MKVFLVGYMGVGKSTTGKRIAAHLGIPFADLDQQIEAESKMSVSEIFAAFGEQGFREKESALLMHFTKGNASAGNDFVLATGGGASCHGTNMDLMLNTGIVVWLQLSPKAIAHRLQNAKTKRPLLEKISAEDLPGFIENHLAERTVFYERAHLSFNTENATPAGITAFAERLRNYSR
jgi:shikimate kinase